MSAIAAPEDRRPERQRGADPEELATAAATLLSYYLAGRRSDDELLAQVETAWRPVRRLPGDPE